MREGRAVGCACRRQADAAAGANLKFNEATGQWQETPRREFLHVDDLAEACIFLMRHYDEEAIVNVGVGEDLTIRELAALIGKVTGFGGTLDFDVSKPDGTPRKLLDVSFLSSLGWRARIPLEDGVKRTYEWFKANYHSIRG